MSKPANRLTDCAHEFLTLAAAFAKCGVHIVPVRETKETCTDPCYDGPFPRYGYNVKADGVRHHIYTFFWNEVWALRCAVDQLRLSCGEW